MFTVPVARKLSRFSLQLDKPSSKETKQARNGYAWRTILGW